MHSDRADREDPAAALARLQRLAHWMDSAIPVPGTSFRIGLDPILGLLPGLGDGVAALLSSIIVAEAARLGAPRALLFRMLGNVGLEVLVGSVPVIGDVFDAAWRANQRNVALLATHLERPRSSAATSGALVYGGLALLGLALVGLAAGGVMAIAWLVQSMAGA